MAAGTKPQRVNPKQVEQFLADAHKKASAARKNLAIDEETAYQTAYQAMIKGSLALMLSYGQRPRLQLGHHIAIIEFAQRKLAPSFAPTFALFDRMRRKRNDAFYDIATHHARRGRACGPLRRAISEGHCNRYSDQNLLIQFPAMTPNLPAPAAHFP